MLVRNAPIRWVGVLTVPTAIDAAIERSRGGGTLALGAEVIGPADGSLNGTSSTAVPAGARAQFQTRAAAEARRAKLQATYDAAKTRVFS